MNLEEAKANIGKEVVLDESTKPYTFISHLSGVIKKCSQPNDDQVFTIHNTEEIGNVIVRGTDAHRIHPRHLKLKEQSMNYKICVTPETSAEVQELFFELGFEWKVLKKSIVTHALPMIYNNSGYLYTGFIDGNELSENQEITLSQLRDMVVLKSNDVSDATHTYKDNNKEKYYIGHSVYIWKDSCWKEIALNETYISGWLKSIGVDAQMTWEDALRSVADGKEVEVFFNGKWQDLGNKYKDCKFRIKPKTMWVISGDYTKEELLKIAGEME